LPPLHRLPPILPLFPYTTLFRSSLFLVIRKDSRVSSSGRDSYRAWLEDERDSTVNLIFSRAYHSPSDLKRAKISNLPCYHARLRSEEHTSELQSRGHLVCRLLLE